MNPAKLGQISVQQQLPITGGEQTNVDQSTKPKLDNEARASQSQLLQSIVTRPLKGRNITVDNLISKDGFKMALGKANRYANLKDAMMRAAFKLTAHKKADPQFGSLHKASIRLAENYHQLVEKGAPESERIEVLRTLRGTLSEMLDKHVGSQILKGKSFEEAQDNSIRDMLKFVDHEIGRQPGEHLRVAHEMLDTGYAKLRDEGASITTKTTFLNIAREHLLAAQDSVGLGFRDRALITAIDHELDRLETHAPLKTELEQFVANKEKNLKHVHTRVSDPVADMRAEVLQKNAIKEMEDEVDIGTQIDHLLVGLDIRSFDKSSLRHVETEERTGLEDAMLEFSVKSFDDSITQLLRSDHAQKQGPVVVDPKASDLGARTRDSEFFQGLGTQLGNALRKKDKPQIALLTHQFSQVLAGDIGQRSKDVQLGFVTSRGEAFKEAILQQLAQQTGGDQSIFAGGYAQATPEIKAFVDEAYSKAVRSLDNRLEGETLHMDGLEFTKSKEIGAGAFGSVSIYTATDRNGKEHRIVVKEPLVTEDTTPKERAEFFDTAANEVRAHRSASEGGNPNIIPFRGAVQTPDGRILIAMDLAQHGNVSDFGTNLSRAIQKGVVPERIANLIRITLLEDMVSGMRHLQESRGITHIDIKPDNYFISGDGIVQLGDFGLADTSLEREFHGRPLDASTNMSTEIAVGSKGVSQTRESISDAIKKLKQTIENEVPKLPDGERQGEIDRINQQIEQLQKISAEQSFTVNEKSDTFALGMMAYGLFKGKTFISSLTDSTFEYERGNALVELGQSDKRGQVAGTGATAVDRLLNNMLDPDPDSRLGMSDLMKLSLFSEPGVGSKEVRDLIKLISDPNVDQAKLKEACDKMGV